MSRIGRKPIPVPNGVEIAIDGQTVTVKGPKGTLSHTISEPITVERGGDGTLAVVRPDDCTACPAPWSPTWCSG
jgi:large subunit ribosomal protein L6